MVGEETILVVDDDVDVRRVVCRVLRDAGFKTMEAEHVGQAIEVIEVGATPTLIISDVQMPGLSVVELLQAAGRCAPPIPLLLMSGEVRDRAVSGMVSAGEVSLLPKPFSPDALLAMVGRVLGRPYARRDLAQ